MHTLDFVIFGLYLLAVLGVGLFFFFKNRGITDYFVCDRNMGPGHVGFSVVATDVGGGFSIGLGGLGYTMGLAGHWLLFTGFLGAWISAVLIVPLIKKSDVDHQHLTYPQFLRTRYNRWVALLAALISMIGYWGFTGGQIRAGVVLAEGTILRDLDLGGLDPKTIGFLLIGTITVLYTVLGGLSAVIYTDTVQWIIVLVGLIFIAIPMALHEVGGFSGLAAALPPGHLDPFNISPVTLVNWLITITPIWLIAMTLYQRIYACRDVKAARRAWFIAGLLEWPVMAFMGVILGMCGRALFPDLSSENAEQAVPLVIAAVLPIGLTGIVVASYFSAIMSTADSCLVAASGNLVGDVVRDVFAPKMREKTLMRLSVISTLIIGVTAIMLAWQRENVLEIIMKSYGFMVGGLFIPTLGAMFWKRSSSAGAMAGMLVGGTVTLFLQEAMTRASEAAAAGDPVSPLLAALNGVGLDGLVYGLFISAVFFVAFSLLLPEKNGQTLQERAKEHG